MDMSPMASHHSGVFSLIVLMLVMYPLIVWGMTKEFRRTDGELSRATIAFCLPALFLGMIGTWHGLARMLFYRALSGRAGGAVWAAGAAEAIVPLIVAFVVATGTSLAFLVQSISASRRGAWHPSRASWWFDAAAVVVFGIFFATALQLTRDSAVPPFSFSFARAMFFAAIIGVVASSIVARRRIRVTTERVAGPPALFLPIACTMICAATAFVCWHIADHLTWIAIHG